MTENKETKLYFVAIELYINTRQSKTINSIIDVDPVDYVLALREQNSNKPQREQAWYDCSLTFVRELENIPKYRKFVVDTSFVDKIMNKTVEVEV